MVGIRTREAATDIDYLQADAFFRKRSKSWSNCTHSVRPSIRTGRLRPHIETDAPWNEALNREQPDKRGHFLERCAELPAHRKDAVRVIDKRPNEHTTTGRGRPQHGNLFPRIGREAIDAGPECTRQ